MADLTLESKANGTWEYEIVEIVGKDKNEVKIKHKIKKGLNEIPESHIETLESDHGYKAKIKRGVYEVLKGGKAIKAKKADEKPIDDAKDLEGIKEAGKTAIADLKEKHVGELRTKNEEFTAANQKLTNSRGEALQKVKDLEEVNLKLTGELATAKGGTDADNELLKTEITDLKSEAEKKAKDHESALSTLKTANEKAVKTLEGAKSALEKKVKDQAEEIKKLKKG